MNTVDNLSPLPEPVAYGLWRPDGTIDHDLVGSRADCEHWSRADKEPQSGWAVVGTYTADQMRAYGEACAAAERERGDPDLTVAYMAGYEKGKDAGRLLDCRLCMNYTTKTGGCMALVQCVDADGFQPTSLRQYWMTKERP